MTPAEANRLRVARERATVPRHREPDLLCHKGHGREQAADGQWRCRTCEKESRDRARRREEAVSG